MLTQEQISNLKKGDKLLVEAYFVQEGCSYIKCALSPTYAFDTMTFGIHPYALSLPSEHGTLVPTTPRLFKKGDIVELDTHGRDIAASMKRAGIELGERYTVTEDENNTGYVSFIGDGGIECHAMFFWLKLVTPVEELEPYKVDECGFAPTLYVRKNGKVYLTIPYKEGSSLFQTHEEALAAAEAERDRLNAEWRKEHAND